MKRRFVRQKGTARPFERRDVKRCAISLKAADLRAYFQAMKGHVALILATISVVGFAEPAKKVIDLKFSELIAVEKGELKHSAKAIEANGKRVRLTGYMAHMESGGKGGFWLTKRPVFQDESGAGTGDLPPNAVYVSVRSATGSAITFIPRPITVTGVFQISKTSPQLKLILDKANDLAEAGSRGGSR